MCWCSQAGKVFQLWVHLCLLLGQPLSGGPGLPRDETRLWCHIRAAPHRVEMGVELGSCCGPPQFFPEVLGSAGISWSILRPLAGV